MTAWGDDFEDWSYRKTHAINPATGAGTNYPVKITVHAGAGNDNTTDVYCSNHCKTDFGDIRFTDNDGNTELSYWIESQVDNDSAVIWIKVADSLESSAVTIYMYYGNAGATTTSSGVNTFIFFENFNALNDGDLNGQNGWSGDANADVQTTVKKEGTKACQITGDAQEIDRAVTIEDGYKLFVELYMLTDNTPASDAKYPCDMYIMQGTTHISALALPSSTGWNPNQQIDHLRNGPAWQKVAGAVVSTWYKLKLALLSASTHAVWINDVQQTLGVTTNSGNVTTGVTKIRIERYNGSFGSKGLFDQIVVGKYVSPEPAHSTWGEEEEPESAAVEHFETITEYIGGLDTRSRISTMKQAITEKIGALDTKARIATLYKSITDKIGSLDSKSRLATLFHSITEKIGALDTKSRLTSLHISITEKIAGLDSKIRKATLHKLITEKIGSLDSIIHLLGHHLTRIITEFIGAADTAIAEWIRPAIEWVREIIEYIGLKEGRVRRLWNWFRRHFKYRNKEHPQQRVNLTPV